MIEIVRLCDPAVTAVRMRGFIPLGEFEKLPYALCELTEARPENILFDWSKLDDWRLSSGDLTRTDAWTVLARSIGNVAIVHHSRWNRQAAWIAALLRLHNVRVRSWRRDEVDLAIAWLNSA